jgi:Ca2+-binding RTX toxin-like protein
MGKNIFGTDDDDGLDGTNGNDTIIAYAGDDVISGGNGNDVLIGDGLLSGTRIRLVSTDSDGVIGGAASFNASFAPSGTQLVFESDAVNFAGANGVRSIYTKDLVTGALTLISSAQGGAAANGNSSNAHFSGDGKSVVFTSVATNLTGASDTNAGSDIFVKDLTTGVVTVVSTMKNGSQATGDSDFATLSSDGTKVLFQSTAEDLVGNDSNGYSDIFVKNLKTGTVRLLSADADGVEGNGGSGHAVFSANGKLIAFESTASSFVSGDSNGVGDVFVKDLVSDDIIRVSSAKDGTVGNASSSNVSFDAGGNKAIFTSYASNLVGYDNNDVSDVFIKNLNTGGVRLVSTNADGELGDGDSFGGVFSPDGTRIAFFSNATNLVDDDTNGVTDAFVKDLVSGDVYRTSLANSGLQGNFASTVINWSPDGTQLIFQSQASNLTTDTNTNNAHDVFVATIDFPADGDDVLDGGAGNDTFLPGGGADSVTGGTGDDTAYFRGNLDSSDTFDGTGGNDMLVLDGDYIEQVALNAGIVNIDTLRLAGHHTYGLKLVNANVAAGDTLTIDGSADDAAHALNIDGSAELDGTFAFIAGAGNDNLKGGAKDDTFDLTKGGNDTVDAGGGTDTVNMGGALTAADKLEGGTSSFGTLRDTVVLDGNYASGLTLGATTLTGFEKIVFAASHDYKITFNNATVADNLDITAGTAFVVDASALGAENTLTFNGGAELAGGLEITGGAGSDTITGGAAADDIDLSLGGNDTLNAGNGDDYISLGGAFGSGDKINGGAGTDNLFLSSIPSLRGGPLTVTSAMISNIETINFEEEGHGTITFKIDDTVVAAGKSLQIYAGLTSGVLVFDGSAETNGILEVTGSSGADNIKGGKGNDIFHLNNGGNDTVNGNDGNDQFMVDFGNSLVPGMHLNGGNGLDKLVIGQTSGALTLASAWLTSIEQVIVQGPASLNTTDATLAAGRTLVIDASTVNDVVDFDGSAETNAHFHVVASQWDGRIEGGQLSDTLDGSFNLRSTIFGNGGDDTLMGGDTLTGGSGNDTLMGLERVQTLFGGSGSDTFKYLQASDSWLEPISATPLGWDWIKDFDANTDKIDVWFNVTGTNAKQTIASLDHDASVAEVQLEAAFKPASLGAHHAALLAISSGESKGTYIVIDANGSAGFQAEHDMIIKITGATHLANFSSADFI